MKRLRANWNHSSQEIESLTTFDTVTDDWLKEVAWQLARLRELEEEAIKLRDEQMKIEAERVNKAIETQKDFMEKLPSGMVVPLKATKGKKAT